MGLSFRASTRALVGTLALTSLLSGCGENSDSLSNLTLTGSLGSSSSIISRLSISPELVRSPIYRAVSYSGYTILCTTFAIPPSTVTGTVAADNTFSLALDKGTPYRCSLMNGSTVVASFVLSDSSRKAMNGSAQTVDTLALNGSGTVSFTVDSTSKSATGDASSLTLADSSADNAFDFTGSYVISSLGLSLPTGYSDICASSGGGCSGPSAGETVYMKRIVGKKFTPDASCTTALNTANTNGTAFSVACGGTTGTEDLYGVTAWKNEASFTACGSRLGFTYDEGKARAQVDLTSSGLTSGDMTWDTTSNGTDTLTDGWKSSAATTSWDQYNCQPTTVGGYNAYKCTETTAGGNSVGGNTVDTYNININGGCTLNGSSAEPNWSSSPTWGTCVPTAMSGALTGYTRNVCDVTVGGQTYSCTNITGFFKISDNSVESDQSKFNWNSTKVLSSGAACSTLGAGNELQQLQCYANYYYQNLERGNNNRCIPKIRTDWTATDHSKFLYNDGPKRARNQHIMAPGKYLGGDSFTFRDSQTDYRGVRVATGSSNSWVNCRIRENFTMTFKQQSSTVNNVVMVVERFNLSTDVSACVSNESSLGVGTPMRLMFKMTKQ